MLEVKPLLRLTGLLELLILADVCPRMIFLKTAKGRSETCVAALGPFVERLRGPARPPPTEPALPLLRLLPITTVLALRARRSAHYRLIGQIDKIFSISAFAYAVSTCLPAESTVHMQKLVDICAVRTSRRHQGHQNSLRELKTKLP